MRQEIFVVLFMLVWLSVAAATDTNWAILGLLASYAGDSVYRRHITDKALLALVKADKEKQCES